MFEEKSLINEAGEKKETETARLKKEILALTLENETLKRQITTDVLTGVLNRRGADDFFARIAGEQRKEITVDKFAVLFLDLDNFKKINDNYGHDAGDQALQALAEQLRQNVRGFDTVVRWGGEEFLVVLLGADENEAMKRGEELRKIIERQVKIKAASELKMTVSIGVAASAEGMKNAKNLITQADQAMYEAKHRRGKNNVVRFSELGEER